jgi:FtsH ternary system domain X3-analog
MAEMTIRLFPDPATGKKNIVIALRADEDALPHEHEQMHRALVEKLVNGGLVKAEEVGQIIVQREDEGKMPAAPGDAASQVMQRAQKQSG